MQAQFFKGVTGVVKQTPNGGKVTASFGHITLGADGDTPDLKAIAIQILDKDENTVAEFALLPETFGTMIEAIKELFEGVL